MANVKFNKVQITSKAVDRWHIKAAPLLLEAIRDEAPIGETGDLRKNVRGFRRGDTYQIVVNVPYSKWVVNGRGVVRAGSNRGRPTGKTSLWWGGQFHGPEARPSKKNDFIRRAMKKRGLRDVR